MKAWMVLVILHSFLIVSTLAQEVHQGTAELAEIVFGHGALARQTLCVIDDDSNPVVGAKVQMSFVMPGCQWIHGQTDTNGCFSDQGQSCGEVNYDIQKNGYYPSGATLNISNKEGVLVRNGKWQPWDPKVTVILRPIVNPIPMYVRRMRTIIPLLNEFVGYDLEVSDWIAPYGNGVIADFEFRMRKRFKSFWDFNSSLEISVPGADNGLYPTSLTIFQNSDFKLFRMAPASDYTLNSVHLYDASTNYFVPNQTLSYFFCVRNVTNHVGEVVSARYGKIRSYIGFDVRRHETGQISFTYYLNPTPNDRNMEFDPKRNLFKNLRSTETVNEP